MDKLEAVVVGTADEVSAMIGGDVTVGPLVAGSVALEPPTGSVTLAAPQFRLIRLELRVFSSY